MWTPPRPSITSEPNSGSCTTPATSSTPGVAIAAPARRRPGSPGGGHRAVRRADRVGVGQVEPDRRRCRSCGPGRVGRLDHDRVAEPVGRGDRVIRRRGGRRCRRPGCRSRRGSPRRRSGGCQPAPPRARSATRLAPRRGPHRTVRAGVPSGSRRQAAYRAAWPSARTASSGSVVDRHPARAERGRRVVGPPTTTAATGSAGCSVDDRAERGQVPAGVVGAGGRRTTATSASTSPLAGHRRPRRPNAAGAASGTEVERVADGGGAGRRLGEQLLQVRAEAPERSGPAASAASAARTLRPPALPITASRLPAGSGWSASIRAASSSSPRRVGADHAGLREQRVHGGVRVPPRPRCATRRPAARPAERPLLTASTGLRRASARAVRANRRGLPNDSRYSATARVAGSSYQYASRSLPLTSALLPSETNVEMPHPVRVGAVQDRDADRAGLRGDRQPTGRGHRRREAGGQPDRRIGVDDAEAVGADQPHAVRAGQAGPVRPAAAGPSARPRRSRS